LARLQASLAKGRWHARSHVYRYNPTLSSRDGGIRTLIHLLIFIHIIFLYIYYI
jgi:hypothetical protein